jgi:outer membrane protein OmpA-like peptidoglycan-associated protein/tetratricopeptide (TPR) repeat protein
MVKYLMILFFCLSFSSFGQNVNKQVKKTSAQARSAFEEGDYFSALLYYKQLDTLIPKEDLINAIIAVCYQELGHFDDALISLNKAISYGYTYYDHHLIRGKIYHSHHDFDEALKEYYLFKENLDSKSERYNQELEEVDYLIKQCDTGFMLKASALVISMSNLGEDINTHFSEYAPVISSNEEVLFFTSRRPNTTGGKKEFLSGKYYEDIYISVNEDGDWSEPKNLEVINTNHHDACVGLSSDGKALLIYRPDNKNFMGGDLYISYLKDSLDYYSWSVPENLGNNINTNYWEPSACISPDYKTIYFSSNRPGGFGGTDIYRSELEDGVWGEAVNMGPVINTNYDEDSPYITPEGNVLYFSSKGHQGMGGFDIFMSADVNRNNGWIDPVNIGYPINSAKDDLHFSWNLEGTKGYFSSVRDDSFGELDLYHIVRPESSTHKVYLKGIVTDSLTGGLVKNARVSLIDKKGKKLLTEVFTDSTGRYKIPIEIGAEYEIHIESNGYVSKDDNFKAPENEFYYEIAKNLDIKPYSKDAVLASAKAIDREGFFEVGKIENMMVLAEGDHFAIRKVHFIFNEAVLEDDSYEALNDLVTYLKAHKSVSLEVAGHTDNVGTHQFNAYLSQKRADEVVRYLTSKGVNRKQLKSVGYGETKPLTSNTNEQGRRLNRRAEFTVMKTYVSRKSKKRQPIVEKEGKTEILKWKVHFPFNEWQKITQYSQNKLVSVIEYLQDHPNYKLKIHAHADPIGSYEYNRALSQRRANTVRDFLITNGVSQDRLIINAFGEDYPLIETESIQFNVKNRRVEFEIVK